MRRAQCDHISANEYLRNTFVWFTILIILISCEDIIDIEEARRGGDVVIFGAISNSGLEEHITISVTSNLKQRPRSIDGAEVNICDDQGTCERLLGRGQGQYLFRRDILDIIPGKSYYLEARLITGSTYRSIPQKVPDVFAKDSVNFDFDKNITLLSNGVRIEKDVLRIKTETELFGEGPVFLRWRVNGTYIILPTDFPDPFNNVPPLSFFSETLQPQTINLFAGTTSSGLTLNERILAYKEIDYKLRYRYFYTTVVYSINRESYEYWDEVNIVANTNGSIFDIPPAALVGNLFNVEDPTEKVLGYFEVSNATLTRFETFPSDIPFTVPETGCMYEPDKDRYPPYCGTCFGLEDCTNRRPDFLGG